MTKYRIEFKLISYIDFDVTANTQDEAEEMAELQLDSWLDENDRNPESTDLHNIEVLDD